MQGVLIKFSFLASILLYVCVLGSANASDEDISASEEKINYQEVFFQFYRKDEYNALVNLKAGLQKNKILKNKFSNELLIGNLYSMYGLSYLSERSLKFVATQSPSKKQRVIAWFYLAKQYFSSNDYKQFYKTSLKIKSGLPKSLREEMRFMRGMYYIQINEFDKVENYLDKMRIKLDWYNYLKFNLGVSYLKLGRFGNSSVQDLNMSKKQLQKEREKQIKKGLGFVHEVAEEQYSSEDMYSLKDKAKIVLGYYYIRSEKPKSAIKVFESVRLNGPFSNKALLGLGWAYSQQQHFKDALVPWLALARKNDLDTTVQEAKLAAAFAFRQLGAEEKSLTLYKRAIDSYQKVKKIYNNETADSLTHNVFSPLLVDKRLDDYGITQNLTHLFQNQEKSLLINLLKTESFQLMFNEYRDLKQLQDKLTSWNNDLEQMEISLSLKKSQEQSIKNTAVFPVKNIENTTINYQEHLAILSDTVQLQHNRMEIMLGMYEEKIRNAFINRINVQQQYLTAYLSQARFGLAEILDNAQKTNNE